MVCISQRITLAIIFRSCVDYNEVLFFEYILRSFQLLRKRDLNMKPQYQIKSFHDVFLFWNWHYSLLSFFVRTCCYRNINMKKLFNCISWFSSALDTIVPTFLYICRPRIKIHMFYYTCSKNANVKKKMLANDLVTNTISRVSVCLRLLCFLFGSRLWRLECLLRIFSLIVVTVVAVYCVSLWSLRQKNTRRE